MRFSRRVTRILLVIGASVSGAAFLWSLLGYFVYRNVERTVVALAPLEKDYVTEAVKPLIAGQPKAESALDLVRSRLEESRLLHKGWLDLARATFRIVRAHCFIWGGVFLLFLVLLAGEGRARAGTDNAL